MICKNCSRNISKRIKTHCCMCNSPLHEDCAIKENNQLYCDVCYTVKEEEGVNIIENVTIPKVIRRSYIETYKSCPYKFYLQVIKGVEKDYSNIYAQIGIDLHKLFEKACHNHKYLESDMFEEFLTIWDNYSPTDFDHEEQRKMLYERAITCIEMFYKVLSTLPKIPHCTEKQIIFNIGENLPAISTTSDRIDLINGELEVSDWKTGKTMVGQKLSSDLQAPLYIYGIRQEFNLPIRRFTFYYLQEDKQRVFERTTNDDYVCKVRNKLYHINITDAVREVQSIFSHIIKKDFNVPYDTKKMYFTCKMCHLREKEICKGADIQSWKMAQ